MGKRRFIALSFISVAGAALNIAICYISQNVLTIPLFLDTIFTMTLTFYGGVFWGVLTGALTNLVFHSIFFVSWPYYLYTFCNISVALITALFIRWFPRELNLNPRPEGKLSDSKQSSSAQLQNLIEKAIILILLSFALCIVISVLGGIFSTLINVIEAPVEGAEIVDPGKNFRLALQRKGFPAIMVEIASRIPVNILDRLISSFAGFGIAMLMAKKSPAA